MTTEVKLAKCMCGENGKLREFHKDTNTPQYDVLCPNGLCFACTPAMKTPELAAAAWNRMMAPASEHVVSDTILAMMQKQEQDARNLLSALADELQNTINILPGAGSKTTFPPTTLSLCATRDAIRTVLAKNP